LQDRGQSRPVGFGGVEAQNRADDFIPAALASYGIEADEIELAVIGAAQAMFWPAILELLELDAGDAVAEPSHDLSRAPVAP
jgi:hypothetical protein